jgi:hypothetical protein
MSRLERWGGTGVLVVEVADAVVDGRGVRDLGAEAYGAGASMLALPVDRLEPAFFDLRSGVAGDILQASVTYRFRLAIVGDLPEPAASSNAFAALVRESNAGSQHWFVDSLDALRARLEAAGP